jgi:hypothetical protein
MRIISCSSCEENKLFANQFREERDALKSQLATSQARCGKFVEALESCKDTIHDEVMKTVSPDGEVEYWVSHSQIQSTVDSALNQLFEKEKTK